MIVINIFKATIEAMMFSINIQSNTSLTDRHLSSELLLRAMVASTFFKQNKDLFILRSRKVAYYDMAINQYSQWWVIAEKLQSNLDASSVVANSFRMAESRVTVLPCRLSQSGGCRNISCRVSSPLITGSRYLPWPPGRKSMSRVCRWCRLDVVATWQESRSLTSMWSWFIYGVSAEVVVGVVIGRVGAVCRVMFVSSSLSSN